MPGYDDDLRLAHVLADAVERICTMLSAREDARPADVLTHNILSSRGKTIRPKTLNQKRYVDAIDEHTIVFGIGPAGTGKPLRDHPVGRACPLRLAFPFLHPREPP